MNLTEAEQVFNLMHSHWPPGSIFRFFAKKPGQDERAYGMVIGNPSQLMNACNWAEKDGWNCYVQMNPSVKLGGTRAKAQDITHWCWLLIDIDPIEPDADPAAAAAKVGSIILSNLGMFYIHAYSIDSGRGVQGWCPITPISADEYRLFRTRPISVDDPMWLVSSNMPPLPDTEKYQIREAAPRAMAYWMKLFREKLDLAGNEGCTVDLCPVDMPRVMRMPYTVNARTGKRSEIVGMATGTNTSLGEKLLRYAPHTLWKPSEIVNIGLDASAPWQVFVPHMTRAGRMFLTEGAEEGGRHHAAVACVRSLRDLGCSATQARLALIEGGRACSPVLDAKEVDTIIGRNYNVAASN